MIEITYFQLFVFITIIWIITRCIIAMKSKTFSVKHECRQLLVYVCIVVICLGRHTDVDDLILNTIGVAIGAYIVFLIRRKQKKE